MTPVVALVAAVCGVVVLVPPALAATQAPTDTSRPVAVALAGLLDTSGLAEHPTISRLTVTNTGANPLGWSLRAGSVDQPSAPVSLDYWQAGSGTCSLDEPATTGAIPTLAVGQSVEVCVRMAATASGGSTSVPVVTVVAQSA